MNTPAFSEEELIALLRSGSREGFNYLYKNYSAALYGQVLQIVHEEHTAEDVLQESFVKIWTNIAQYEAGRGRLYTWMLHIARNAAIDKLRSKGEIMQAKIRSGEEAVNGDGAARSAELRTDTIGLRNMVAGLRPEYKAIVELAYYKGYTLDEISKTLGTPLGTVKTRIRAAMKELRKQFSP